MKRRIRFTVLLFAALLCTALAGCAALSNIPTKAAEPKTKESRQSERDNTDKEGSGREKEASDAPETKPAGTQEDPEGKQTAPEKETKKESKILHIITRKKDGTLDNWIKRSYEGDRLLSSEDTKRGLVTYYDEEGRELTVIAKSTGAVVEEYRYDEQGNIVYFMPRNATSRLVKDHQGNAICYMNQNGAMPAEYEYDEQGRVTFCRFLMEKYYKDVEVSYTYEYSADGLHLDVIRYCNGTMTLSSVTQTYDHEYKLMYEYDYDGRGHIIREKDYSVKTEPETKRIYDENGRLEEVGTYYNGKLSRRTTYEYDTEGYLLSYTTADSDLTGTYSYVRDENGTLLDTYYSSVTPSGWKTHYMSESNDLNSHGDVAVKYEYLSGAGSRDDWYLASYYIYDYDGIDPYVVMQSKNLPASYLWENVYADALRKGSALSPRLAQAYLDVLPEDDEANSRFFVSAAFADLNADEIPEMICITKSVSEPYGFEITSVEMTIYTAEGDKARQLYQGEIFAYGGTMTGTCRLFQTESSADLIVYSMDPTGAEEVLAYEVLSYKDGAIEEWKIYSVQSYYSDKGGPEFYRNGEPISRELYDQYAEPLQTPVANEIYHGSPNDNEMLWPDFFGDWRVTGLTRAAAVRVLTEAGAVP